MKFLKIAATLVTSFLLLCQPAQAEDAPAWARKCLERGLIDIMTAGGDQKRLAAVYRKYTNFDLLGTYLYGDSWTGLTTAQKKYGHQLYFSSLVSVTGKKKMRLNAQTTEIVVARKTDHNPILTKYLNGQRVSIHRVTTTAQDDTGKSVTATVYLARGCQFFDLQSGKRLSSTVDVALVERYKGS